MVWLAVIVAADGLVGSGVDEMEAAELEDGKEDCEKRRSHVGKGD